jgi:hypothetical protein
VRVIERRMRRVRERRRRRLEAEGLPYEEPNPPTFRQVCRFQRHWPLLFRKGAAGV